MIEQNSNSEKRLQELLTFSLGVVNGEDAVVYPIASETVSNEIWDDS